MDRNLALELVRVTEAAALSCGRWVGMGDKNAADRAATEAMRRSLEAIEISGTVVIGEGEMDEAPMLYIGEKVGSGNGQEVDIAVDPLEGTSICAKGLSGAIATIALAPRGGFLHAPDMYMEKIAVGPSAKGAIDINLPAVENLRRVAAAKGCRIEDLTVVILDRPRHDEMVAEIRKAGARIRQIPDGDVAAALMTSWTDSGVDVLLGIGGTPEGVLAACALRAMGGEIQGKLYARDEDELRRGREQGYNFDKVLTMDDLVSSEDVFFAATGITDGELLKGVHYYGDHITTDTLVVRGLTGTVRQITATHKTDKLDNLSSVHY
jgi:fructose-1,6-bisphosphatase II